MAAYATATDSLDRIWPSLPLKDAPDGGLVDSVLVSELGLTDAASGIASQDFLHRYQGEFGACVPLTSQSGFGMQAHTVAVASGHPFRMKVGGILISDCSAPLVSHIGHVVGLRADPEMAVAGTGDATDDVDTFVVVSDAGAYVARVKDAKVFGNRAACRELPGNPMGALTAETPIPVVEDCTGPQPTTCALADLCVEPSSPSLATAMTHLRGARWAAESATTGMDAICPCHEWRRAMLADARNGTLVAHRDYSSVLPRAVASGTGVSCVNYTTDQIGKAV